MNPILLVHGYSAESERSNQTAVTAIYGTLPRDLRKLLKSRPILELNVSRYISLEDGIKLDDLATAMDLALSTDFPHLLKNRFDVIIHSTGALVVRNWLRLYSSKPSPIERLIYLAGANFGSGWAHLGRSSLAKWGRFVFQAGAERGVQVLNALEFGSNETIDLHHYFLQEENNLLNKYEVREFCISGSQVNKTWLPIPVRYAHEDGTDGVVRVASCNTNINYVQIEPTDYAYEINLEEAENYCSILEDVPSARDHQLDEYYEISNQYLSGDGKISAVPFAIPYECAHVGEDIGIVRGEEVRNELLDLLQIAFDVDSDESYEAAIDAYNEKTQAVYKRARKKLKPGVFSGIFNEPRKQYDAHAMVIFRLRDQFDQPIENFDVFFDSIPSKRSSFNNLFEHTHKNKLTKGIIVYYLRLKSFDKDKKEWLDQLNGITKVNLEIIANEPQTDDVKYLPICLTITKNRLKKFVKPHCTTIVDVTLLRFPSQKVFQIFPAGR